jgi:glycosyltransferase 2 family protein
VSSVRDRTWSLRNIVAGLIGVAVAAVLLAWCFRRAGFDEVWATLSSLTLVALLPALACEVAVQLSKALKWTAILSGIARVRYRSALVAVVIGAASTHLVPLRLDEVLRAGVLGRREGLPSAQVLGTVAIDRVIEVMVAGVLLGIIALFSDLEGWMKTGARVLWVGFVVGVILLVAFVRAEDRLRDRLAGSAIPLVPRIAGLLRGLTDGLRALPRGRALVGVVVGAVGEWSAAIVFYWWALKTFAVEGGRALPVVMSLGNAVAYAVPNVPGALGTYEAVQTSVLTAPGVGLEHGQAMAVALAAHAVLMIPVTVVGVVLALIEWRRPPAPRPEVGDTLERS